jgi:hypothetical protein
MPERLWSWRDWTWEGLATWIILSICFGILFNYTINIVYDWWRKR